MTYRGNQFEETVTCADSHKLKEGVTLFCDFDKI